LYNNPLKLEKTNILIEVILVICEKCKKRFGKEGVNFWSAKISKCETCKKDNQD
jgi:hypothetical protein